MRKFIDAINRPVPQATQRETHPQDRFPLWRSLEESQKPKKLSEARGKTVKPRRKK